MQGFAENGFLPFSTVPAGTPLEETAAVVFGAPHCTPYPGIDNTFYARAAEALRRATRSDWGWLDHHDFDLGRPMLGDPPAPVLDLGDLATAPNGDAAGNRAKIAETTRRILAAGAAPLMIGGDDSVPIPFIEALAPLGPLTIVQIDAHIDWREERMGEPLGFSSTMRRASEMAHIERIVQVGIRGIGSARPAELAAARDWGARIVTAAELDRDGVEAALAHVPEGATCVVTFDCDGLDPAIMPAVMGLAPGGLSYVQAMNLIAGIAAKARIAAMDVVEFVPERDPNGHAAMIAGRIACAGLAAMVAARTG